MAVSLMGDFNGDGAVNTSDHLLFVVAFGLSEGEDGFNSEMDLNGDGTVDTADFLIFSSHFPNDG
ncbi:MAG: dockerin type I domain-containing protein [Gemmatimonadetes bacterium]|nr:dockerin type I domain-containing protein [Gemmatimonadota bacterium]